MQVQTELGTYEYIYSESDVPRVLEELKQYKYISLDTENSGGLDPIADTIRVLLLQLEAGGKAFVIDVRKVSMHLFSDILSNRQWIKIIQNAVYDYKMIKHIYGIPIRGIFDTQTSESLLFAGLKKSGFSLEVLAESYAGITMNKDTVMSFVNHPYDEPFSSEQLRYAADDVLILPRIHNKQQKLLTEYGLNQTAALEFALIEPVAEMELAGVRIDDEMWKVSLQNTKGKLFEVAAELRSVLPAPTPPPPKPVRLRKDGTPYANQAKPKPPPVLNLDSWKQLVVAFEEIGVDLEKANSVTKRGLTNNSTIKYALTMYRGESEKTKPLNDLLTYRGLNQVVKTFGDNLLAFIRADGRIHARFNPNGTDSGRFSSTEPNLQNIQKKGTEGKILRSCFIPADGYKYIIADYSQIELRIAAELSNDIAMMAAFQDPSSDIHRSTASQMYKVPYDKVTNDLRKAAKTLNFGIIYGMMIKTLSERLNCSTAEAQTAYDKYVDAYDGLMKWLTSASDKSYKDGRTSTMGGRIRWFPRLDPDTFETKRDFKNMVEYYKRVGRNHPVQGTSADMTKTSIVLMHRPLLELNAKLVNTIHDEVCVEAPVEHTFEAARIVRDKMIEAGERYLKNIPVLVDVKIRDCWFKDDDVEDDEYGQQLWLMPNTWGLDLSRDNDDDDVQGEE